MGSQSLEASMRRLIRPGIPALLLLPHVAWSLAPPSLDLGTHIRITELGEGPGRPRSGTVVAAGADTIVLRLDSGGQLDLRASIALNRISAIEVSRSRGHTAAGVGLGFLAGAGTGALAAALGAKDWVNGSDFILSKKGVGLIWAGVGGFAGMVVGGMAGSHWKTETWEAVPSSRWQVGVGSSHLPPRPRRWRQQR